MHPTNLSKIGLIAALSLITIPRSWATPPPALPTPMPPLVQPAKPSPTPPLEQVGPVPDLTPEGIQGLALSPVVQRDLLASITSSTVSTGASTTAATETARAEWRLRPDTTIETNPIQATLEINQDQEPVIASITSNTDGATCHATAYMKFPYPRPIDANAVRLNYATTTDLSTFTRGELPVHAGVDRSGDPTIAENPYLAGQGQRRMYLVGSTWHFNSIQDRPNKLALWTSDDGGRHWALRATPIAEETNGAFFLDKASIAVSWAVSTVGYIYVAVARVHLPGTSPTQFLVYRSTDGGATFTQTYTYTGTTLTWCPQLVVDRGNGDVYLAWLDYGTNRIYIARSTTLGNSFGTPVNFTTSKPLFRSTPYPPPWPHYDTVCDSTASNCTLARSAIAARFNYNNNSIGVVWHQHETSLTDGNADVYFNMFSTSTQSWGTAHAVPLSSVRDQWNAALDYDTYGNYQVTFYSREGDNPSDARYLVYSAKLNSSGVRLEGYDSVVTTIRFSDPTRYTQNSDLTYPGVGEYQDVWNWNGKWYAAYIQIPDPATGGSGTGDVYISRIAP